MATSGFPGNPDDFDTTDCRGPDVWDELEPTKVPLADLFEWSLELLRDVMIDTEYTGRPKWPRLYKRIDEFLKECDD